MDALKHVKVRQRYDADLGYMILVIEKIRLFPALMKNGVLEELLHKQ
jgi:hypothetical protein